MKLTKCIYLKKKLLFKVIIRRKCITELIIQYLFKSQLKSERTVGHIQYGWANQTNVGYYSIGSTKLSDSVVI